MTDGQQEYEEIQQRWPTREEVIDEFSRARMARWRMRVYLIVALLCLGIAVLWAALLWPAWTVADPGPMGDPIVVPLLLGVAGIAALISVLYYFHRRFSAFQVVKLQDTDSLSPVAFGLIERPAWRYSYDDDAFLSSPHIVMQGMSETDMYELGTIGAFENVLHIDLPSGISHSGRRERKFWPRSFRYTIALEREKGRKSDISSFLSHCYEGAHPLPLRWTEAGRAELTVPAHVWSHLEARILPLLGEYPALFGLTDAVDEEAMRRAGALLAHIAAQNISGVESCESHYTIYASLTPTFQPLQAASTQAEREDIETLADAVEDVFPDS